jgi:probable addiction module antidote protein
MIDKDFQYETDQLLKTFNDAKTKAEILKALNEACSSVGFTNIAEAAKLNRSHLYRALSEDGNPNMVTILKLLKTFKLKLKVVPIGD